MESIGIIGLMFLYIVLLMIFFSLFMIISDLGLRKREIWFVIKPSNDPEMIQLKIQILKIWKIRVRNTWASYKRNLYGLLLDMYWDIKNFPGKSKRLIWNKHILMVWNRLWIRKDEFHSSLDMDIEAMMEMNREEREEYSMDLVRRRMIAHNREMSEQDAKYLKLAK